MGKKEQRLVEYSIEAVIIAWLAYLFFYQNFLLHTWHRGLPLPPRWPFAVFGIIVGALFFWYEWRKTGSDVQTGSPTSLASPVPADPGEETPEENLPTSGSGDEAPQEF